MNRRLARWAAAAASSLSVLLAAQSASATGVDPTRISLPSGPGSIEGLGRNFVPSLASGTASYGVDLAMPPAAGGFEPRVSLDYDSGGGISDLGMGWRIGGIPSVRRSVENGLPKFDETDVFELSGFGVPGPLVQVSPGIYRPEWEPGTFVRAQRATDGSTWEVRDKAGITYRFGTANESENGNVVTYLLDEAIDLHGHVISYAWDTSSGHGVLQSITWNAYAADVQNVLTFQYENRPDVHTLYSTGIAQTFSQRATQILITHGGSLVRRYDLAYTADVHSRLATVTLVGSDGATKAPTLSLTYTAPSFAAVGQVVGMASPPGRSPGDPNVDVADMNGDSLPDLLVTYPGAFGVYLNQDGRTWQPEVQWTAAASPSVELSTIGVQLADMDGDGAIDLVVKSGTDDFRYFPGFTAQGFGAPVQIATVPTFTFEDPDVALGDMDGDRRIDVVQTTVDGLVISYNLNGTNWSQPYSLGQIDPAQPLRFSDGGHTQLCDLNGDRIEDFCYLTSGSLLWWPGRGRGAFDAPHTATGVPSWDPSSPWSLHDLDGDGWADLVHVDGTQVDVALATEAGTFGAVQSVAGTPQVNPNTVVRFVDMDGSGSVDIVWIDAAASGTNAWQYLELFPSGRAGLLATIDNGLGRVVTNTYATAAADAASARAGGTSWTSRMNVAMPVVRSMSVNDSLGDPPMVTEYHYANGTFSPIERTFAGFAGGAEQQDGDANTPTLAVSSTFDVGIADRTQRGLTLTTLRADGTGYIFDQTTETYQTNTIDTGLDGTAVSYTYKASEQKTEVEGLAPSAVRTTLTEWTQDSFGNATNESRWGEVVGTNKLAGNDEAISIRTYAVDAADWLVGFLASEELQDAQGNRIERKELYYDGAEFVGLPLGQVARGDVAREQDWVGPDPSAFELEVATRYDADGHALETKDARGGGHLFTWDLHDHTTLLSETVKLATGSLSESASTDRAFGNLTSVTGYDAQTTSLQYDALGRLVAVVRPGDSAQSPTVTYAYDERAPLSRVVTHARVAVGQSGIEQREDLIDGLARKRGTLTAAEAGQWILANVTLLDARGQSRKALRPRFVTQAGHDAPPLVTDYLGDLAWRDALGRSIRAQSQLGISGRTTFAPFVTSTWDGAQSDPSSPYEHTPIVKAVDGLGRLVSVTQTLGGAPLRERYTYDAAGALLSKIDPEGSTATYAYDGRGRRTKVQDPDVGLHAFVYDPTGDLTEHHKPNGVVTLATFDLAGRPLTEDWDGDGNPEVVETWDVSARHPGDPLYAGKLVSMTDPTGSVEHEYDVRQRVVATHRVVAGHAYDDASAFDDRDRETLHTYPDGSSLRIAYDVRGLVAGYGQAVGITRDADGAELQRTFNTGVAEVPTYDADRRVVERRAAAKDGSVLQDLAWTYDGSANISSVTDRRPGIDSGHDRSEKYGMDNLYRLTSAEGTWGSAQWTYSPAGNLLRRTSTVPTLNAGDMTYGAGAGPHALTGFMGRTLAYDALGRMKADGDRRYGWDAADHLVQVARDDGSSQQSLFDGTGDRRVRTEVASDGTTHTTYFLDPWSEVRDGQLVRFIVHGAKRIVQLAAGTGAVGASATLAQAKAPDEDAKSDNGRQALADLALRFSSHCIAMALLAAVLARYRRRLGALASVRALPLAFLAAVALFACSRAPRAPAALDGTIQTLSDADTLLFADAIGSLDEETSGGGSPRATSASYPFGLTRFDTSDQTRKFAGTPRDASMGLDQMGARAFAPDLGVWTAGDQVAVEDPSRGVGASFAANNPYAYAADRPTVAADRDGHFVFLIIAAIVIGSLITTQFANAPETSEAPLLHKGTADLALDTAHNAAIIYGTASFGAAATTTIVNEGAVGALKVGTALATGTVAVGAIHQVTDAADPSGRLTKVADIALVAQAEVPSKGLGGRLAPAKPKAGAGRFARPGSFRAGVRSQTWDAAVEAKTGQVRDPVTGRFMTKDKPWDMGHKPGYEFSKHAESAETRDIDRDVFLDEHNDPSHYRPELPSSNRSHAGEAPAGEYKGP